MSNQVAKISNQVVTGQRFTANDMPASFSMNLFLCLYVFMMSYSLPVSIQDDFCVKLTMASCYAVSNLTLYGDFRLNDNFIYCLSSGKIKEFSALLLRFW